MRPIPQKTMHNLQTRRAHRRQVIWQIFLPLLLGIVFAGFLFALVLRSGSGTIERSAQTATILLSIPVILFGLLFLSLLVVFSLGLGRLLGWLPGQSFKAQKAAQRFNSSVTGAANAAKQPFMLFESWGEAINRVLSRRR
jgi:predicted PurR-regulated permease PerM